MEKMKFNWVFSISEDKEDLVIMLNDGVNVMIEINHESYFKNLAEKMFEIMYHEHTLGTKTTISGMAESLNEALRIKNK